MPPSQSEILKILADGDFDTLLGQFEAGALECKRQPYGLDTDERRHELAKDVSGLANANGGLLLIGFATQKEPTHGLDVIDRVRPFPLDNFNADQYRQVIRSWLWPALDNVEILVFPASTDRTHGVAAIVVPEVMEENRPLLIAKTVLDGPRKIGHIFGYYERKQDHVVHHDLTRLHALLRDGRRFDSGIRHGFQVLQAMIESIGTHVTAVVSPPPENVDSRIGEALRAVGRHGRPAFVLASIPKRALSLRALFEARNSPLVELLENPPTLRRSGFDLNVDLNSRIVEGRLRRAIIEDFELLEFHRDGVAIFVTPGDGDRLCWSRERRQQRVYLINQMALLEMTYLFCKITQRLYEGSLQTDELFDLEMEILRLRKGDENFILEPGSLDGLGSLYERSAPSESKICKTAVRYGVDSPERAAVLLLSELYSWVGYDEDQIPYTTITEEGRVIDPHQIITAGR